MYTFKNLVFGVDFNNIEHGIDDLNFIISDIVSFSVLTDQKHPLTNEDLFFQTDHWYHGSSDKKYLTGCIGFRLTSNESKDYIKEVRSLDEDFLMNTYNEYLPQKIDNINSLIEYYEDEEIKSDFTKLIKVLNENKPTLHEVEASS